MTKCTVRFETRYFERAHGKQPRGFGSWAFALEHAAASASGSDIFWAHGATYAEAKKKAAAHFKALGEAQGEQNLYVAVLS